jgi:hypothetical protein
MNHLRAAACILAAALLLPVLALVAPTAVAAQVSASTGRPAGAVRSVSTLLNADGTLRTGSGVTASLDARGYRMVLTASGSPRFIASSKIGRSNAVASDANWNDSFAERGVGYTVYAVAVSGNDVYVGGYFTSVAGLSGTPAGSFNHIAHWTGQAWLPMGAGVGSSIEQVNGIAVSGSNVYVVGTFTTAGSVAASHVAQWNGTAWSAMGSGLTYGSTPDSIEGDSVAVYGGNIVVGGVFTAAGGVAANSVAVWNGAAWSALGAGIQTCVGCGPLRPGTVDALAVIATTLYAGGAFQKAGSVVTNSVAAWNGSAWSGLSTGVTIPGSYGIVKALAVNGTNLYVGGSFQQAGTTAASSIARWNGSVWSALGTGVTQFGSTGTVNALQWAGGLLYIGGAFDTVGGVVAAHLATWDGTTGAIVGANNLSDDVSALALAPGGGVEVGGPTTVDGIQANYIARWSGSAWSVLGDGTSSQFGNAGGTVWALGQTPDGSVYAGGALGQVGGTLVNGIGRWDGTNWNDVGGGVTDNGQPGTVSAVVVSGTNVYVGGAFTAAGGVSASNVAKWNGTSWSALGTGANGFVSTLLVAGTYLYVGGRFSAAGSGVSASDVARFNMATGVWSALGAAPQFDFNDGLSSVTALAVVLGRYILVGGDFTYLGPSGAAATVNGLVFWDSTVLAKKPLDGWYFAGGGVLDSSLNTATVSALAVSGTKAYVGGNFVTAGNALNGANQISAAGLAVLDLSTQQWSPLGTGLGGGAPTSVGALALTGTALYVAGSFTTAGSAGAGAAGVAEWSTTTSSWAALGSGIADPGNTTGTGIASIDSLFVGNGLLVAGGDFTSAGTKPSKDYAEYSLGAVPSAPTAVAASAGDMQATVSWTAPSSTGGSPTTAYAVTAFIGGVAQWPQTFLSTATSQVVTGLTNGVAYTFTVAAINAGGTGTSSAASSPVTPVKETSTTVLKLSLATVTYGHEQLETLSVTVAPQRPGSTPTGSVTIKESTTTLCTITLALGKGSCVLSASKLAAGSYHLVASYGGSTSFDTSVSASTLLTVAKATSKTALTMSATKVTYGSEQTEHLSVTVSPEYSGSVLTGTVTIKEATTTLCTISLSSGKGSCTLSANRLPAGTYYLVATYGGSTNFGGSASIKETLTVVP